MDSEISSYHCVCLERKCLFLYEFGKLKYDLFIMIGNSFHCPVHAGVLPVDPRCTILSESKQSDWKLSLSPPRFSVCPKWLSLTGGPGLIIRDRYPLCRPADFPLLQPPHPPSCVLEWKLEGKSVEGKKSFFTQLQSAISFEPLSAALTLEMSETAITWTLYVFCRSG